MSKSAVISVRVDPDIKANAEAIYNSLGITLTEAITIFLYKSIAVGGIPFELKQEMNNERIDVLQINN